MKKSSRRKINVFLMTIFIALGIYIPYADRRTPVETQSGQDIHWTPGMIPMDKETCRIATYNIHRGKGTDDIRNLKRTASVLVGMDVVGLNEVAGPSFLNQSDQAQILGEILSTGWLFAPNQRRWHRYHFGNGLLSRIPIKQWIHEPLAYDKQLSRSHRNLLQCQMMINEHPVSLFVTHIDRGEIRSTQLQFVLQLFSTRSPAILIGDLNTREQDPILAQFLADPNNVDALDTALGPKDPEGRIDWIFTRGLTVLKGGMHPTGISDHPCYWVDIVIPDPNLN